MSRQKPKRVHSKQIGTQKNKQTAQPPRKRAAQYNKLTEREKATYERALNLLSDLRRRKGSYSQLLRKHHITSRKARKHLGRDLIGGTPGKRIRASKSDRRVREVLFPTSDGDVLRRIRNSRDATKLSEYFHDRDMLLRGKLRAHNFEVKWRGMEIADGEVFADTDGIFRMADADVLKVDDLYGSTGGER